MGGGGGRASRWRCDDVDEEWWWKGWRGSWREWGYGEGKADDVGWECQRGERQSVEQSSALCLDWEPQHRRQPRLQWSGTSSLA